MKALLLIAHGSRREASNQEVRTLAQQLGSIAPTSFSVVVPAFLELAEPDIPTGVSHCVEAGTTQVIAVPYFLAAGRHVVTDIPEALGRAQRCHPDIDIQQTGYLGIHHRMPAILLDLALSASTLNYR